MGKNRSCFYGIAVVVLLAGSGFSFEPPGAVIVSSFGKQPSVAVDNRNNIHIVFGEGNDIFYSASKDGGVTFSAPARVATQERLALGASRGPQIISTRDYLVIAAADHRGAVMTYRLKPGETTWTGPVNILKNDSTAKEGFVALAAGKHNKVYAAWLDLRMGKKNNVFSAYSDDAGQTWSAHRRVYVAPEGGVCPCCRPSIAADSKGNVYVMFRNELKGARDLYLVHSGDGGNIFAPALKLGRGTWLLEQCPMDGGALSVDSKGNVGTTWRRDRTVYYAEPGKEEVTIGAGRASTIIKNAKGNYLAWNEGNRIMVLSPDKISARAVGTGSYPRLASLNDEGVICVWESDGHIFAEKLP